MAAAGSLMMETNVDEEMTVGLQADMKPAIAAWSDNDGYQAPLQPFAEFARNTGTQVEDRNKNSLRDRHKSVIKKLKSDSNLHAKTVGLKHVLYEVCFNIFIPGFAFIVNH